MLLFCAKTAMKESHSFELAHLMKQKKRKKEERKIFQPFGDFMVQYVRVVHFHTTRSLLHETYTQRSMVCCYKGLQ